MDPQEANSIARHLTQLWTNLLRSRVINNQDAQAKAFLNQLKANGQIVFKYEEQELQVSENRVSLCRHRAKLCAL